MELEWLCSHLRLLLIGSKFSCFTLECTGNKIQTLPQCRLIIPWGCVTLEWRCALVKLGYSEFIRGEYLCHSCWFSSKTSLSFSWSLPLVLSAVKYHEVPLPSRIPPEPGLHTTLPFLPLSTMLTDVDLVCRESLWCKFQVFKLHSIHRVVTAFYPIISMML